MPFEIVVLGTGAAYPRAGSACAGYLLRTDTTTVWLECGNGTFSRLQQHCEFRDLDAIIISHDHPDHLADLAPAYYAYAYDHEETKATVICSKQTEEVMRGIVAKHNDETFYRVLTFVQLNKNEFKVGDLTFTPFITQHSADTYGFRITDGTATLAYTSDTGWFDELPVHCKDADLLIADSTYVEHFKRHNPPDLHMYAEQAGRLGAESGARRLLLSHIWGSVDPEIALKEAAVNYPGVELCEEGQTYRVKS